MRLTPLLLILILLPTALAQEQQYTVSVSASPPECATATHGSGSYRHGSQATIEVRVSIECRFVKWVFRGGGLPEEVSANPFTFYVFGDMEATAILEKLYRDNGTAVERVYIAFTANISSNALTLPKPKIVRPGESVDVYAPQEVLDGDYKYVFLYWSGPDGLRVDSPSYRIVVEKSITLVANYYTLKKFLDEYYPIHIFVKPSYPDIELADGGVERATALTVKGYNITIPIQPVPEPLLNLVEPVYVKYYPYIVSVEAPQPVPVNINGQTVEIGSSIKLMGKEGGMVVVEAPSKTSRLRLEEAQVNGRPILITSGDVETIALPLTAPSSISIRYTMIPYASLLDIPLVGDTAYRLTETGYGIIAIFTDTDKIPYPMALALPIALIAAPGAGAAYAVRKISQGGIRASIKIRGGAGLGRRRIAQLVEDVRRPAPIVELTSDLSPESRFQAPAGLVERVVETSTIPAGGAVEEEAVEEAGGESETLAEEVEELEKTVAEGEGGRFKASLLQLVEFDERYFEAVQTGRLKLEPDSSPVVYSAEVMRLAERAAATPSGLITISGGDRHLRHRVVETALARAGRKWVRAGPDLVLPPEAAAMASVLKKAVKGFDTIVVEGFASKTLAQAAVSAKILAVSMLERGGEVELPPLSERLTAGITAWLLLERNVLKRLSYDQFKSLVEMAKAFRGLETVNSFAGLLDDGVPPSEALDELWAIEFRETFPGFETRIARRILESGLSYGDARDLYITAYKQVTAGGDPQAAWRRFINKLERLGVKIG